MAPCTRFWKKGSEIIGLCSAASLFIATCAYGQEPLGKLQPGEALLVSPHGEVMFQPQSDSDAAQSRFVPKGVTIWMGGDGALRLIDPAQPATTKPKRSSRSKKRYRPTPYHPRRGILTPPPD